jgi:mRNA-degrading endonuclease toxin of MazEF toxin-antitoxin module
MTSDIDGFADSRLLVEPTTENGLRTASVVMTEKIYPVSRARAQAPIGRLSELVMAQLNNRLAFVLGLGD